jgi:hypothetical protein
MTVVNESALEAVSIYILPSKSKCCWSRDLLEGIIIPARPKEKPPRPKDKSERIVHFDDGSGACRFHIRITTRYPSWEWLFYNIEVCEDFVGKSRSAIDEPSHRNNRKITLDGELPISKGDRRKVDRSEKNRWMVIDNRSKLAVQQIFIIPSDEKDCCWSHDLLPIDKKVNTKRHLVNLDDGSGKCTFDIRITSDKEYTHWYLENVDVCRYSVLRLKDPVKSRKDPDKRRKVTIINETGIDAATVRAKPMGRDCCWSRDLLGEAIIQGGKSLVVDFDDDAGTCEFDYRIRGSGWAWVGKRDFCSVAPDQLPEIRLTQEAPKDGTRRRVTIKNDSSVDVTKAIAKPKGKDCCWSDDLLGTEIITSGESLVIDFNDDTGTCEFDYRITRSNGWAWVGDKNVCSKSDPLPTIPLSLEAPKDGKRRVVMIKNDSSVDAIKAFAKPEGKDCCESDDLLGTAIIQAGKSLDISLDDGAGTCKFDYRITRSVGQPWIGKIDACREPADVIVLPK